MGKGLEETDERGTIQRIPHRTMRPGVHTQGIRDTRLEAFATEHGHAGSASGNRCNPRISE